MLETDFNFHPSAFFKLLIIVVLITCALIVLTVQFYWWGKALLLLFVCSYGLYILWRYVYLSSPHAIQSIKKLTNGEWQIATKHKKFNARLCGDSTVSTYVCILKFTLIKHRQFFPFSTIVFPDSLKQDEYRKLLVLLKCS